MVLAYYTTSVFLFYLFRECICGGDTYLVLKAFDGRGERQEWKEVLLIFIFPSSLDFSIYLQLASLWLEARELLIQSLLYLLPI